MKKIMCVLYLFIAQLAFSQTPSALVEAENFDEKGGWVVDQQFIPPMGSPYLLAHGMGEPVENAKTTVEFPESGRYWFWVRTKEWVQDRPETPGTFKIIFDGEEYPETFGVNQGWQWVQPGRVRVDNSKQSFKDSVKFRYICSIDNK